jgi:outer membrane protein assembly factor BamE (lipoprotein component of BamABCDE complex)
MGRVVLLLAGIIVVAVVREAYNESNRSESSGYHSSYTPPSSSYSSPSYEPSPSYSSTVGSDTTRQLSGYRESTPPPAQVTFTLGSTRDQVRAAQGTPTEVDNTLGETWWYGPARVEFQNGHVYAWSGSPYPRLNVVLETKDKGRAEEAVARGYFTLGSTKDEVLALQGTPDQLDRTLGETWWYGAARISFSDGKVYAWSNTPVLDKLKVELHPRTSAEAQAAASRGYYGPHASKDEVLAVEGTPQEIDRTLGETWWYSTSTIGFSNGHISEYESTPMRPLKIRSGATDTDAATVDGFMRAIKDTVDKAADDVCACSTLACANAIAASMRQRGMSAGAEYMRHRAMTPELEAFQADMLNDSGGFADYFKRHDPDWFSRVESRLAGCAARLRQANAAP